MGSMSRSRSLPYQSATSTASPSMYQAVPPQVSPVIPTYDIFARFPDDTIKSAADPKAAKATMDKFEDWIKNYYGLHRSRNRQIHNFEENDFRLQKDEAEIALRLLKMRSNIPSEDQPSKEAAHKSPPAFSDAPTESAPRSQDFPTTILAQLDEKDPEEVGAALMLDRYELPIVIHVRKPTKFTLRRSELIFHYSEIKQDGLLENLEELEMNPSGKSNSWSDITFSIESPYWRLYRRDRDGDRVFVAPKTKTKRLKQQGTKDKMWVREEAAGDTFLALGWLVENNQHGARTTRYVCALNTSTNPVSMWLIYDYRQPNDDGYLYTSEVPTPGKQDLYLDPPDDGQGIAKPPTGPAPVTGKEGVNKGYMDQPKPWDLACLYDDAETQWPKVSSGVDVKPQDTSFLTPYGDPDTRLRAKRMA